VVKLVVVGGERNPASLSPSFRVRGRELEGKKGATVAQADGLRMSRGPRRHPGPVCLAENWSDERPSISSIVPPGACRELDGRRGAKAA